MKPQGNKLTAIIVAGAILLALILIGDTIWMGHSARKDTEEAVRSVSLLYLDELAGRREQVVENNLKDKINTINVAMELMTENDLSSKENMEAYQTRMKRLYNLQKFAFVDEDGLIYTSTGYQDNIDEYDFDYKMLDEPTIFVMDSDDESLDEMIIIAVPAYLKFNGKKLNVCFMAMDIEDMLEGVSMTTNTNDATFCNIYTSDGHALTNAVLGGLAKEDNLLGAMEHAQLTPPDTYENFIAAFTSGERGVISFTYDDIRETLAFIPIAGTDWQLTYLIRESVISERIDDISMDIVRRSILQSLLTVLVMVLLFGFIISTLRHNNKLLLEQETRDAENRIKQEELEHRLELQDQILEEQRQRSQQSTIIDALSADYWSVYYLDLDTNEGICYRHHDALGEEGLKVGQHFNYVKTMAAYVNKYVDEQYREGLMEFIQPESVREGLKDSPVISYTYMVNRGGNQTYEQVRFAAARGAEEKDTDKITHASACLVDVDSDMKKSLEQNQALSDALALAEDASRAKTAFLSNMSHEIRTPMNAIISLNSIALNDPDTNEKTRDYLTKIEGSAEHLMKLINDILDMSRIEAGRMTLRNEEFSMQDLLSSINAIFSSQCEERGITYSCRIVNDIADYYIGDNMKLRQVLINILGNAVKFTPEGGSIEFGVERKASFNGKSTLSFRISDTGIGISKEFLPRLFETFAQEDDSNTNKYGSSGLGLAITKSLVDMMNGDIDVRSTKGVGTSFTVTVTLNDSDHKSEDDHEDFISPDKMTVLIVDDDPIACDHAKLVLEEAGISADIAHSGAEAIDMVQVKHARREPYNLILVDWKMPEMDGVETTRRIRSIIGHESAIIILTAYNWDDILEEAMHAGVDSFTPKPLFASSIMEEFHTAMKRKGSLRNEPEKAELNGRRILLAEDTKVNAEIMMMLLKTRGIEAELAVNGRIAVDMFSSNPPGYYDAILMDVRMPEMDGLEATRTIRAMERDDAKTLPIIALTANAFDEDVQRSLQAGLNAHLSKPVDPVALFETLEHLIKD